MDQRKFFKNRLSKPIKANTMNCKNCRTGLIGYFRGTLAQGEEIRIREHLSECAECRSFADYLQTTLSIISQEKRIMPDPFLATRIEGILTKNEIKVEQAAYQVRLIPALVFSFFILAGIAGGIGLGNLLSPQAVGQLPSDQEFSLLMDDIRQEPIEAFIMGLNELQEK